MAGVPKGKNIHSIRHNFALTAIESGVGIRKIQQLLNHRNLSTTEIYTEGDINVKKDAVGQINFGGKKWQE